MQKPFNEKARNGDGRVFHKASVAVMALGAASMTLGIAEPALILVPLSVFLGGVAERKAAQRGPDYHV